MFDTDLTELSELALHNYGTDVRVSVYKVGGGTLGRAYTGAWGYDVTTLDGREIASGEDLTTGMPKTHREVIELVIELTDEF